MDRQSIAAEIVILRDENWKEEKKLNLKKMIEAELKGNTGSNITVIFSDIPSKFLYSSNAAKMRATIRGVSGGRYVEMLLELFGTNKMKAWLGFEPHLYVEESIIYRKNYKPLLWAGATHDVNELSFGCIVGLDDFIPHFKPECRGARSKFAVPSIKFLHDMGRLQIKLPRISDPEASYLFNLSYSSIKSIILSLEYSDIHKFQEWVIYFNLNFPPIMESLDPDKSKKKRISREKTRDYDSEDEEVPDHEVEKAAHIHTRRVVEMAEERDKGKDLVSRCNVIRISLAPDRENQKTKRSSWRRTWKEVRNIQRKSTETIAIYFCGMESKGTRLVLEPHKRFQDEVLDRLRIRDFAMMYALKCVNEISFKLVDELDHRNGFNRFKNLLEELEQNDVKVATRALYDLFYAIDSHEPVAVCDSLRAIFDNKKRDSSNIVTYDNMCEVRRCILTPSRAIFLPPILHTKSRFLRDYDPDHALWVHLRDDDLKEVAHTVRGDKSYLDKFYSDYIRGSLLGGFQIGDRIYEFMGCSSSQLRDCGMFLYARDDKQRDAQSIRREIGNLQEIKSPAKQLARLGQAFSQPMGVYEDHNLADYVFTEPDEKGGRHPQSCKPYNFTDGCGRISKELAELLSSTLRRDFFRIPSAYQIRFAGFKGLLVVDSRLSGREIRMRESMKKFDGYSKCLDVLKSSAPTNAFLCKPLINILNQKGIESYVFLQLQTRYLRKLTESYTCQCKASAVLKSTRLGLPYGQLANSGIDILAEVFFRKGLDTVVQRKIHDVKERARIELDRDLGRVMFGAPDSTNTLKEGEVFFQYSSDDDRSKRPINYEGDVVITKFPCTHQGDVRKFKAVKFLSPIPGLTDLIDVLVFPVSGTRPHSNEMSGSDYDGDEYFITWDPNLIFSGDNSLPVIYPDTEVRDLVPQVEVRHMLEFYEKFIRGSGIGQISSAHLAISDRINIFDPVCEQLAKKCSIALDFAKTGEATKLEPKERPEIYPDFMDKDDKPMYQSHRALGHMHREIEDFRDFLGDIPGQESENDFNVSCLTVNGWQKYKESAIEAYNIYVTCIQHVQKMHGIEDEISLVYDCFKKGQKYLCGRNEKDSVHEVCHRAINNIMKKLSDKFYEEFQHIPIDLRTQNPNCQAKASAWYLMTREINKKSGHKFYLLPWIMSPILIEIARSNGQAENIHVCSPCPSVNPCEVDGDMMIRSWGALNFNQRISFLCRNIMVSWFDQLRNYGKFDGVGVSDSEIEEAKARLLTLVQTILSQMRIERFSYSEAYVNLMKQLYDNLEDYSSRSLIYSQLRILVLFSLFRFYRTRETKFLWDILPGIGPEYVLKTFCLSMRDNGFRSLVESDFIHPPLKSRLKEVVNKGEIKEMVAKVHESSFPPNDLCLVTVIGTKRGIWKLKNAFTKRTFYQDILNPNYGKI